MNELYDVLDICLQELENGADLDSVLANYPDLASELRPILKASLKARAMAVSTPSPEAVRRGRAKVLQHAAQLREAKLAPRRQIRMIPSFQRLAISLGLTALFLTSGTGLVGASSSALPGEKLYPVKLTWENVRLLFTFNNESREALESSFENERLHEINELFVERKDVTIRFSGIYTNVNGVAYIAGIRIVVLDTSILPLEPLVNGMAVEVTGLTNAQGFVDVSSIKLLPQGSAVATGEPPLEIGTDNDNQNFNANGNSNLNDNDGVNFNENDNDIDNLNLNVNSNENVTSNGNDNGSDDSNNTTSVNDNTDTNTNTSVNDNTDSNTNTSVNDNSGSNTNTSANDNTSTNTNSNSNDDHGGGIKP